MKTTILKAMAFGTITAAAAHAQLPEASAISFGMASNYMAAATGFNAMAFNPAMLGINAPKFSISLFSVGGHTGLDPVKLNDITSFEGVSIPAATKEEWLTRIGTGGKENGALEGGVNVVAVSAGHIGFQLGVVAAGDASINQDAAEALLFGNAGRTGVARSFNFAGSNGNGSAFATAAVSIGIPVMSSIVNGEEHSFALGVTGKYIMGIGAVRGFDNGSVITPDNIKASFPAIYTNSDDAGDAGSGVGLDLGAAYIIGKTTISVAARNVVNSFEWQTSKFRSVANTVNFDGTTNDTDFDEKPYGAAPATLRAQLENSKFKPELAAGIARQSGDLLLTADGYQRLSDDGISIGPKSRVGVGAQYSGLPVVTLRGGVAAITGGFQAAGGLGIRLGTVEVSLAISSRSRDNGTDNGAMVTVFSIH